ncbi:MAG: FISUMP domain-containing protein, partial [Bacteroidia bacterium]
SPTQQVSIPLRWAMFNVARVNMITAYPGISPAETNYPNPLPLAYDSTQVIIPGTTNSTPVTVTLQAFDGNGGYLNSLQFTSFLQSNMFFDTRDGKTYPVIQVGNQLWMAQNLDYAAPSGSAFYNNNQANEATYGRLYTVQAATTNIPKDWRLPSQADWNNLIAAAGTNAYAALIAGGSMGLNAQLGGYTDTNGVSSQLGVLGYYWSQSPQGGSGNFYASFSSRSSSVSAAGALPVNNMLSVRYVRDIS